MGFERFMTKHFGGVPRSFKDLEWIYRVRPSDPAIVPAAHEYRTVSPGIGSGSPESNVSVNALPPAAPGIKHVYESSLPHLGPSDLNPDLHIRGVK
ncbi:hypothetical protein CcCBS67573_g05201 [Chytriomyces confervae]|uniref:Uncharacterized protein n=1 Tax=Chytriomyces confervae TaxID=246404 RepID=A0A507FCQ8_9FUNG|nr:hypothetical protein CcCBS67573_g05201 [Chytriomyces confervae]